MVRGGRLELVFDDALDFAELVLDVAVARGLQDVAGFVHAAHFGEPAGRLLGVKCQLEYLWETDR